MRKQNTPFIVKVVRTSNGERLPTLLDRASGLPDFDATLWVVTSLRNKNLASETIAQALRSIIVLYIVFRFCKISLTKRLQADSWLTLAEVEEISKAARQTTSFNAKTIGEQDVIDQTKATNKITSLEKFRMVMSVRESDSDVDAGTTSIRMGYIREFLKWRINRAIARATNDKKEKLIALRDLVDVELKNKTPTSTGRASLGKRIGIDRQTQNNLLNIVTPTNQQNPWTGEFIRSRNHLIINSFLALGVRRGELLGMRVGDIKPYNQEVFILRRPDDAHDPRLREPNTKTRDRALPLSNELYRIMQSYMFLRHDIVRGRHEFLVVANTGSPLSSSEINQIFKSLDGYPELSKLSPHILRHSFCENLADDLYTAGKSDDEILYYLRRLGGWSEISDTPRRYTKRFAQERAAEAGMSLQEKLYINVPPQKFNE
ncbi:MAG: site-specific integrase [Gallionellaceae bacterium]